MSDLQWGLEFTHPGWLAAVVAVPWVLWYFRRSLVDFARWQRAISTGVRVAIVLLLVLALAGLTLLRPTARQFVIVAVDQSLSVGEELLPGVVGINTPKKDSAADRFLNELLAAKVMGSEDRMAFVPFERNRGRYHVSGRVSWRTLLASKPTREASTTMGPTSPRRLKRQRLRCRRTMCRGFCC